MILDGSRKGEGVVVKTADKLKCAPALDSNKPPGCSNAFFEESLICLKVVHNPLLSGRATVSSFLCFLIQTLVGNPDNSVPFSILFCDEYQWLAMFDLFIYARILTTNYEDASVLYDLCFFSICAIMLFPIELLNGLSFQLPASGA